MGGVEPPHRRRHTGHRSGIQSAQVLGLKDSADPADAGSLDAGSVSGMTESVEALPQFWVCVV